MKKKTTAFDVILVILLGVICITCVLPFIHLLAVSFSSSSAVAAGKVGFLPVEFTPASYEYVISGGRFLHAMGISLERVILGTLLNIVLMVLTAYPLAKEDLPGRGILSGFFVLTMLIGGGMIPTYLLVSGLGLKDTIWALILLMYSLMLDSIWLKAFVTFPISSLYLISSGSTFSGLLSEISFAFSESVVSGIVILPVMIMISNTFMTETTAKIERHSTSEYWIEVIRVW